MDGGESDDVEGGDIVACTAVAMLHAGDREGLVVVAWWRRSGPKGGASGFDSSKRLQAVLI